MRKTEGQTSMFEALGLEDPTGLIKAAPPQTQLKHEAYRRYLPAWLTIMKNQPGGHDLFILDLYAGPGVYLVDGHRSPGSPVIAARAALAVRASSPSTRIHLRCVEPSRTQRQLLNQELDPFRSDLDIEVRKGRAQEHAAEFADECRGSPTLILLDPNGIEVPMAMVSLFGGRLRTEVLISFDAHANRRVAGTEFTTPVTEFWGDDSWRRHERPDYTLDLGELLEGYRLRLQKVAGFRFATVRRVRFPRGHIDRAIAQAAMSTLASKIWLEEFERAGRPFSAQLVQVTGPIDRRARIDGALAKMTEFAGESNMSWGSLFQRIAGVCDREDEIRQALLLRKERGHVDWSGRLGRYERPAPKFTFTTDVPTLRWDSRDRSERPAAAVATAV